MTPYLAILGIIVATRAFAAETILWNFNAAGCEPSNRLTMDSSGNLYGATESGGSANLGVIYRLTPSGDESVLSNFESDSDGLEASTPLVMDGAGNLYGTTIDGGAYGYTTSTKGDGVVFELPVSGSESILWNFSNGTITKDGRYPTSLIMDTSGDLFGTTGNGGPYYDGQSTSGGTFFELSDGVESTLWNFGKGTDARSPVGLLPDGRGGYYGLASGGGALKAGAVFDLSETAGRWSDAILWSFGGSGDGSAPSGIPLLDSSGAIYGTTTKGGAYSKGTVFKLTPVSGGKWTESVLWSFGAGTDGATPNSGLVMDSAENLYGTTNKGGAHKFGTVFEVTPTGETILWSFGAGTDGADPGSAPIMDASGNLYGTTAFGGNGCGVVFEIPKS